jgi:ABC-type nitrate/sulfonate/bicarbonate transport system substrate-binding protein
LFTLNRKQVLAGISATLFSPAVWAQSSSREFTVPIPSTSFATASLRAAVDMGCFRKKGLTLSLPIMESGSNITAALLSGSVQLVLGGPGELVAAQGRGQPVVLLTNCYWGQSGTLIMSKELIEKSGIARSAPLRDRLQVLKGVPIASVSATSALTASFRGAAETVGIKPSFVYMGQPAMVAALESGAVKGYIASAPVWGTSVTRGVGVDWVSAPRGELPDDNVPRGATGLNVLRPFADANPELMARILDAYKDFSDSLQSSPKEVRASLARLYPTVEADAMDLLFEAEKGAWRYRDVTTDDMKHEIAFVKASGAPIPGLDKIDPQATFYARPKS